MENSTEIWQTSVNGQIYETNFDELIKWIEEGAILPQDKVRKGNLRWIEARKVPALNGFFNSSSLGQVGQVVSSVSSPIDSQKTNTQSFANLNPQIQNFQEPPPPSFYSELAVEEEINYCFVHTDDSARFHCQTCQNYFCKTCPKNLICPICGAKCETLQISTPQSSAKSNQLNQQIPASQNELIDKEVKKGAYWFYWIAGMSFINSLIVLSGTNWTFVMGLAITQILDVMAHSLSLMTGSTVYKAVAVGIDLGAAGIFIMCGYFAGKARKWAFLLGLIIYSLDSVLYLLSFSILGIAFHALAIYGISKGMMACRK